MALSAAWFTGDIMQFMTGILVCLATSLGILWACLTPNPANEKSPNVSSTWLADAKTNPAKRAWEVFTLQYAVVWIGSFAYIIAFSLYESFDALSYLVVCGGLCIPILAFPFWAVHPSEVALPLGQRFAVKAIIWIAIYSFIGNYWYTHYFYSILGASYSFPSWRLNDVPIPLYFATFFYFSMYHSLSNMAIRKVMTSFKANVMRTATLIALIAVMAYTTAFMETLTISGFPYYTFKDKNMAYIIGSAFYGIYFIVSFPMFYAFGEWPHENVATSQCSSLEGIWSTAVNSMGGGMLILTLLDVVRLSIGEQLLIKG